MVWDFYMKKFQAAINGRNFILNFDGKAKKVGFYQTVCVECESIDQVEDLAIAIVRDQQDLQKMVLNEGSNPPMLYLDEAWEVDEFDLPKGKTGRGFYVEKKWWQFWIRDFPLCSLEVTQEVAEE